jgi:hypothetical protein
MNTHILRGEDRAMHAEDIFPADRPREPMVRLQVLEPMLIEPEEIPTPRQDNERKQSPTRRGNGQPSFVNSNLDTHPPKNNVDVPPNTKQYQHSHTTPSDPPFEKQPLNQRIEVELDTVENTRNYVQYTYQMMITALVLLVLLFFIIIISLGYLHQQYTHVYPLLYQSNNRIPLPIRSAMRGRAMMSSDYSPI